MIVKEIKVKNIISKSNLPSADYVINPYVGCSHACIYCYARFMKKFTNHEEEWGKFVDIKINAEELIPDNLERYSGKSFFISSVTDPYLHYEKEYMLTRKLLEKLVDIEAQVDIQSKSDLIVRDIDVLKKFKSCKAGITITTLNDVIRKEVEPYTANVEKRLRALETLNSSGIFTYAFIGPIFPYITDWREIIEITKPFVKEYIFENLNIKGSIWKDIAVWLKQKHSELYDKYLDIYFNNSDYWNVVEKEISEYCMENGIKHRISFHHGE
ncbi:MAG: radical SAM protein [Lutisporaceae bacterium]